MLLDPTLFGLVDRFRLFKEPTVLVLLLLLTLFMHERKMGRN